MGRLGLRGCNDKIGRHQVHRRYGDAEGPPKLSQPRPGKSTCRFRFCGPACNEHRKGGKNSIGNLNNSC